MSDEKGKTFANGYFQGRTTATFEGLAHSLDEVKACLNKLPCGDRGAQVYKLEGRQSTIIKLLLAVLGSYLGLLGVLLWVLVKVF